MIQIGDITVDFSDPLTLALLGGGLLVLLFLILLILSLRAAGKGSAG